MERRSFLAKTISKDTFRNLSTLFTGTFLSAIVPIIFSPVMTRIFTTSDYGVLGIYMSISGILGVLAYVHYPQAIMLSKSDREAQQILWFSISFCTISSVLCLVGISWIYFFTSLMMKSPLRSWLFFVPLSIVLNGISSSFMIWANRRQQYKALASNRIFQALLTVAIQVSFGLMIKNETGLILGLIGGQLLGTFLLALQIRKDLAGAYSSPKYALFKEIAIKYRSLLVYSTPSEFINSLINQTPIFLLQKFGGLSYVGGYNFTQRILGVPQQFLSSAIVEVFKQKASFAYNSQGNCHAIFLKTFKTLVILAIGPFAVVIIFAPWIFSFTFGNEWRQAGEFAQFLGILFLLRFIVSPLTYVYIIVGKLKEDFWLHVLFLVMTTLSFYIGNLFIEDKKFLILVYSLSYASVYVLYFFRSYQLSKGILKEDEK